MTYLIKGSIGIGFNIIVLFSCLVRLYWPLIFWDDGQIDKDFDLRSGLAL